MIASAIIFFTLLLALFEKPQLFKRPIKREKIIILLCLFGTAIFSFFKENNADIQQEKDSNTIDSLRIKANLQREQINELRTENRAARKEYVDSIVSFHSSTVELLAKHGFKVDMINNTLKKASLGSKEVLPTLDILDKPVFQNRGAEQTLTLTLTALNADAHINDYSYVFINGAVTEDQQNVIFDDPPFGNPGSALNKSTIIPAETTFPLSIFIDRKVRAVSLKSRFYFGIEVSYKSKSNKIQPTVRKVFFIDYENRGVRDVGNIEFSRVAKYLQKSGMWTGKKF